MLARDASAFVAGLGLPVAMFVSSRSSVLMLALAAGLALVGLLRDGGPVDLVAKVRGLWSRPIAIGMLLFLGYFLLSLGWTHAPAASVLSFGEMAIAVLSAVLLGVAYAVDPPPSLGRLLAIGLLTAALLAIADIRSGMSFRHIFDLRSNPYVLNRTVVCLLVLVWPMLLLVRRSDRWLAGAALGAVALAIWHSESGAALVGALAAVALAAVAVLSQRLAVVVLTAGTLAVLIVSPWIGPLLDRVLPGSVHSLLYGMHSQDRINIWRSFGAAVEQRFWFGSGFNASTRMATDPVAGLVADSNRVLLGAGHPHNALLQLWVEGGLVGALLFGGLALVVAASLWGLRGRAAIATSAMTAACLAIAAVSHGAWQGWWLAVVGLAVVLSVLGLRKQTHG